MNGNLVADRPDSFVAHDAPIQTVRFSPSGNLMATGDTDIVVKVWRGRELVRTLDPASHHDKIRPIERIRAIEFSPDDRYLYVTASDTMFAYDLETGEIDWEYMAPRFLAFLIATPQTLAVSSTGLVAASFDYGSMATFDAHGHRQVLRHENFAPRMMGFSPHGKAIVGTDRFNLCVWDTQTLALAHRWKLDKKVFAMAVSPSEPLVATRELHTLTLWDIDRYEKICELPAGQGLPILAFAPHDRLVATGEKTRIRLVNLECKKVKDFDSEDSTILAFTFTPDGQHLVAGCSDHKVRFWDLS